MPFLWKDPLYALKVFNKPCLNVPQVMAAAAYYNKFWQFNS